MTCVVSDSVAGRFDPKGWCEGRSELLVGVAACGPWDSGVRSWVLVWLGVSVG